MKAKYYFLSALMPVCAVLLSCAKQEPFSVAGPGDEPHIISPVFPDNKNGDMQVFSTIDVGNNFSSKATVTPAQYTKVEWFIDNELCVEGSEINVALHAGIYLLQLKATTTEGKVASRTAYVEVKPKAGHPYSDQVKYERVVTPGQRAVLYGDNLEKVKDVIIAGYPSGADNVKVEWDAEGKAYVSYLVPEQLNDGMYRVELNDAEGNKYGANTVLVNTKPLALDGYSRASIGAPATLNGQFLDKVESVMIGNASLNIEKKSFDACSFTIPEDMAVAAYPFSGKTSDGALKFFVKKKVSYITENIDINLVKETVLWTGHHYVSWDRPDGDPNKTFNLIPTDKLTGLDEGTILRVYYSLESADVYHQLKATSGWWTMLPSASEIIVSEPGVYEVELKKADFELMQKESGFLMVGHGYYVDMVSYK